MIGTIRKHSKWLWWVIAGLTIISFYRVARCARPRATAAAVGNGDYGTLYGHKITRQEYVNARNEFYLFYWIRNHDWPDHNPNIKDQDLDQQIYLRLMLTKKADALGIYVTDEAAADGGG